MINCSFVVHSRFLVILYICIYFVNGWPLENQLAEWATVLKQLKLLYGKMPISLPKYLPSWPLNPATVRNANLVCSNSRQMGEMC